MTATVFQLQQRGDPLRPSYPITIGLVEDFLPAELIAAARAWVDEKWPRRNEEARYDGKIAKVWWWDRPQFRAWADPAIEALHPQMQQLTGRPVVQSRFHVRTGSTGTLVRPHRDRRDDDWFFSWVIDADAPWVFRLEDEERAVTIEQTAGMVTVCNAGLLVHGRPPYRGERVATAVFWWREQGYEPPTTPIRKRRVRGSDWWNAQHAGAAPHE